MCCTANTQITNLSFQVLVRRKSLFFKIFWTLPLFFSRVNGQTSFMGAPSQDRTCFLLRPWSTVLDAFLKKRMAPLTWKSEGSAKYRIEICNLVVCI